MRSSRAGESGLSPQSPAPRAELPRTEGPGASTQPLCLPSPAQAGDRASGPHPSCRCPRIRNSLPESASPSCPSSDGCMLVCYQLYAPCDEGQECSEVVQCEHQPGVPGQTHSLRAHRADTPCLPSWRLESETQVWAGLVLLRPPPGRADCRLLPAPSQGRPSVGVRVLTSSPLRTLVLRDWDPPP